MKNVCTWPCTLAMSFYLGSMFFLSSDRPALAQQFNMAQCPHFIATKWVNPQKKTSGNHWGISLTNEKMSCADATALVKKLMAAGASGPFALPHEVSGGPPGHKCYITPDGSGHVFAGTCHTEGGQIKSIDWGPVDSK